MDHELLSTARNDPWGLALKCKSIGCDPTAIGGILNYLLLNETKTGLELLKALKSNLDPMFFLEILSSAVNYELTDWLEEHVNSNLLLEKLQTGNYNEAYGYMVLLEIMPFIGLKDKSYDISADLLEKACQMSHGNDLDKSIASELIRLLGTGPVTSLGLDNVKKLLERIDPGRCHTCCYDVIVELLNSILFSYPPSSILSRGGLLEDFSRIINSITSKLLETTDKDYSIRVLRSISSFLSLLRTLSYDSKKYSAFEEVRGRVVNGVRTLAEKLGVELFY
ncbi:hypothetical protein ACSU1N_05815 [Thermogladius sp. 4427co]|uniref:hypothetical protein n=1 Tax=Thermogladius sp. 4427co TaxID=3450718 RepID=UPI003F7B1EEF